MSTSPYHIASLLDKVRWIVVWLDLLYSVLVYTHELVQLISCTLHDDSTVIMSCYCVENFRFGANLGVILFRMYFDTCDCEIKATLSLCGKIRSKVKSWETCLYSLCVTFLEVITFCSTLQFENANDCWCCCCCFKGFLGPVILSYKCLCFPLFSYKRISYILTCVCCAQSNLQQWSFSSHPLLSCQ